MYKIPKSRYSMLEGNKRPEIGDILVLDQAYTNKDGKPMVLAYHPVSDNTDDEDNLNNRPRKILGYQTPLEVKSNFGCVALQS